MSDVSPRAILLPHTSEPAVPVTPLGKADLDPWCADAEARVRTWVKSTAFRASPGSVCLVPGEDGTLGRVLVGVEDSRDPFSMGDLANTLPEGRYRLDARWSQIELERAMLGFCLGAYRFGKYKDAPAPQACLVASEECSVERVCTVAEGTYLIRDLVNTPAEDMMPEQLAAQAETLASRFGGRFTEIVGDDLLTKNFPAIHTVGRASAHPPRLLDIRWGHESHTKVTLVGKGVCFDSGGLDIKNAQGMRLMKKDMGGAAHVLGIASMVMGANLPVNLRVLVPAVENAISGNAYRPGDVVRTRKGSSIEIDNTDAEGRVILSDALSEACGDQPRVIIDFATLTGAARVALGTELPAMFATDQEVAEDLLAAAREARDPIWQLPLHAPYESLIESKIADIANTGRTPFGGAITAALFLRHFVADDIPWVHFDVMAWNTSAKPGRPEGGEAMGARAVFEYLSSLGAR